MKQYKIIRAFKFAYLKIIRSNHSPRDIAGGAALGAFVGILPTAGVAMLICLWAAPIMRVNTPAAMLATWVANPWTLPFFYIGGERLGALLLGRTSAIAGDKVMALFRNLSCIWTFSDNASSGNVMHSTRTIITTFQNMYLGTAVLGILTASIIYWFALKMVLRYRNIKHKRHMIRLKRQRPSLTICAEGKTSSESKVSSDLDKAPSESSVDDTSTVDDITVEREGPSAPAAIAGASKSTRS